MLDGKQQALEKLRQEGLFAEGLRSAGKPKEEEREEDAPGFATAWAIAHYEALQASFKKPAALADPDCEAEEAELTPETAEEDEENASEDAFEDAVEYAEEGESAEAPDGEPSAELPAADAADAADAVQAEAESKEIAAAEDVAEPEETVAEDAREEASGSDAIVSGEPETAEPEAAQEAPEEADATMEEALEDDEQVEQVEVTAEEPEGSDPIVSGEPETAEPEAVQEAPEADATMEEDDEEGPVEDTVEDAAEGMEDAEAPAETAETGDAFYLASFFRADEEEATEEPQAGGWMALRRVVRGRQRFHGGHWVLRKALNNCLCERCSADPSKADGTPTQEKRALLSPGQPELAQLKLPNTKATGNLRMALKSKELKEIDRAGSNVSGDISAPFQWQQLEEVKVAGSELESAGCLCARAESSLVFPPVPTVRCGVGPEFDPTALAAEQTASARSHGATA
eukprot:s4182_g1.t1